MKILIVEDNAPFALALSNLLQRWTKKTKIVETTEEAFSSLGEGDKFDTVLLDLTLPDSSPNKTFEAVRRMKEIGAKVIILTGSKSMEVEASHSGADACFCKTDPDLVSGLRAAISA